MFPSIALLAASAARCNSAYIENAKDAAKAVKSAGGVFIGFYQTPDHQAVLATYAGDIWLTHSGTRIEGGFKLPDLFDDIDLSPVDIGGGVLLPRGPWGGMKELWAWVDATVGADAIVNVDGHSLGGARSRYTPEFRDRAHSGLIISFEGPKFSSEKFYLKNGHALDLMTDVIHERDLWCSWPFVGHWEDRQGVPNAWLTDGQIKPVTFDQWPGGRRMEDHDISAIAKTLAGMAAA